MSSIALFAMRLGLPLFVVGDFKGSDLEQLNYLLADKFPTVNKQVATFVLQNLEINT